MAELSAKFLLALTKKKYTFFGVTFSFKAKAPFTRQTFWARHPTDLAPVPIFSVHPLPVHMTKFSLFGVPQFFGGPPLVEGANGGTQLSVNY